MQRAKASLDALQAGRVKTVPLAAFIRPLPSGNYVLVVWWQQSDEGLRKITVRDGSRVLAEFVASEPETEACLTFLQHITVRIATQPPYDGGKYCSPHEQIVRIERDIDQVSLSICIAPVVDATSQDEETIPVVWLDRLSEEYLQKRLEQAAEQRQMLEIAREAWHEAQQELAEERKHAATQESR